MLRNLYFSLVAICFCFSGYSQTINISQGGVVNGCSGDFYDSGGQSGDFSTFENKSITLCSGNGNCLSVAFTTFDLGLGFSDLYIYAGSNNLSPLVGYYTGTNSPGTITTPVNANGCLTFEFFSDVFFTGTGWEASVSCAACPPPNNQDCPNAIPVCQPIYNTTNAYSGVGTISNEINTTSSCLTQGEKNDVWYTFTAQQAGDISFLITPNSSSDDYDWAVYNLTGYTCADIFTNPSIEVSCNYASGAGAATGANGGSSQTSQSGTGTPLNSKISVNAGETYVLNISNFSSSQFGYNLDFSASTASIFDNTPPALNGIIGTPFCNVSSVDVEFSENIKCSSISAADFSFDGPGGPYTITNINSPVCSSGGTDTYDKLFNVSISPSPNATGTYTLCLLNNSVEDICGNTNNNTDCVTFSLACSSMTLSPKTYTVCSGKCVNISTNAPTGGTAPYTYSWNPPLGFGPGPFNVCPTSTKIYTVTATDLSAQTVTTTVTVSALPTPTISAGTNTTICSTQTTTLTATGGLTYIWNGGVSTTSTFVVAPNSTTVYSVTGSDGTCTGGAQVTVSVTAKPSVFFTKKDSGCVPFTANFTSFTQNTTSYLWNFGDGNTATTANASNTYTASGNYTVSLVGNNSGCKDSLGFSNYVVVFPLPNVNVVPNEIEISELSPTLYLTDNSTNTSTLLFDFGDNNTAQNTTFPQKLTHTYDSAGIYTLIFNAQSNKGCTNKDSLTITVKKETTFHIPNSFTPNGDLLNDIFMPKATNITEYDLTIYNRWGTMIFESKDLNTGWNGKINGGNAPTDVYVYKISYVDIKKKPHQLAGHVSLIR